MKTQNNISIKIVNGKQGLLSIKNEWIHLSNRLNIKRYFHVYEWYKSYIYFLEPDEHLIYFIVIYQSEIPIGIFPLKLLKKRYFGITLSILEIPDHDHIDLSDFICSNEFTIKHFEAFINFLNNNAPFSWDCILLPHILPESKTFPLLKQWPLRTIETIGKSHYLSPKEFTDNLSKNFRGNLRKARNKLMKSGKVEFKTVISSTELQESIEKFLELEASGWKGESGTGTAIKLHNKLIGFYKSLLEDFSANHACYLNFLKIEGNYISGQFCLIVGDTCYILKIGYDESYRKLAPGNLLLEYFLNWCAESKDIKFVSLITGTSWHEDWKPLFHKVLRIQLYNYSLRGLFFFLMMKLKILVRRINLGSARLFIFLPTREGDSKQCCWLKFFDQKVKRFIIIPAKAGIQFLQSFLDLGRSLSSTR